MVINHHIAAALASERQRDLVDGGRRWRRAERPSQAPIELPAPLESQRERAPRPSAGSLDGRMRIVRARRLGESRPGSARSWTVPAEGQAGGRTIEAPSDRAGTR